MNKAPVGSELAPAAAELAEHVTASSTFSRSKRHASLIKFLAAEQGAELKETVIGHRFFERPADYDPKLDPVVRVEMRRLRERLEQYYANGGASDPWRLVVPKGSYQISVVPGETPPTLHRPPLAIPVPDLEPKPRSRAWVLALVAVVAVAALAGFVIVRGTTPSIHSIAVLEFETQGDVPAGLAAGLSAEIATALSPIEGLLVIGPTASARAKGTNQTPDILKIAKDLHVDAVFGGTLEAAGSRIRLQMRITRASDGAVLWASSEEQTLVDSFTLQSELATRVAGVVQLKLLRRPESTRPVNQEALMDFRRAGQQIERRNGPALFKAIDLYRSALAKDPEYAAAWGGLAEAYAMAPDYMAREDDWGGKARDAARRALQFDPANADAYSALGWVEFSKDLQVSEARKSLLQALSLNPNHLTAHRRIGLLYTSIGRFQEGEQALQAALRLDPLSPIAQINLAEFYFAKREFAAEVQVLRRLLEANPSFTLAQVMLAVALPQIGQCGEASVIARRLLEDQEGLEWWPGQAMVLAVCGDSKPAREIYARNHPPGAADLLAATVGDWSRARRYFAQAVATQPLRAINLAGNPVWLSDPEIRRTYEALQRKMQAQ